MRISDLSLLARKILVGVVITIVPLAIISGSLWITKRAVVKRTPVLNSHSTEVSRAN